MGVRAKESCITGQEGERLGAANPKGTWKGETMPKMRGTEYRDWAGIEDDTEDGDEQVNDKVDDKDKEKTEFSSDERDSSFRAANQHIVKFTDELRSINEQAALNFDRRKNPAEFDMSERKKMVEAVEQAFNQTGWNSTFERRTAADDIAQNMFQPMYPRVEIAEAAVQHKLPEEFLEELKQEKLDHFDMKDDGTLQIIVNDAEAAKRLVEKSDGVFHIASTRQLDYHRDRFADALYNSDKHEDANDLMGKSLDDAVRYHSGDVSGVRRWDEAAEERNDFWGPDEEESDQRQAEGGAMDSSEPGYREMLAFRNLENMNEYRMDHTIRDILNEKLHHSEEYIADLQSSQHPDAEAVLHVKEALHEMTYDGIKEAVDNGNAENFAMILRNIEESDNKLALEMRETNGFVKGGEYVPPRLAQEFTSPEMAKEYVEEVWDKVNEYREEMPDLHYGIAKRLLGDLDSRAGMVEQAENPVLSPETAEDYRAIQQTAEALDYLMRPHDTEFWKMCDLDDDQLKSKIELQAEVKIQEGFRDHQNTADSVETRRQQMIGLSAMKEDAMEDLAHAVKERDHTLFRETKDRIEADAGEYTEMFGNGNGEVWVGAKPEHPAWFTEIEAVDFEEKKQLYLKEGTEFADRFERAVESAASDNDAAKYMAEQLLPYYRTMLEQTVEYRDTQASDENLYYTGHVARTMTSLLRENKTEQ